MQSQPLKGTGSRNPISPNTYLHAHAHTHMHTRRAPTPAPRSLARSLALLPPPPTPLLPGPGTPRTRHATTTTTTHHRARAATATPPGDGRPRAPRAHATPAPPRARGARRGAAATRGEARGGGRRHGVPRAADGARIHGARPRARHGLGASLPGGENERGSGSRPGRPPRGRVRLEGGPRRDRGARDLALGVSRPLPLSRAARPPPVAPTWRRGRGPPGICT